MAIHWKWVLRLGSRCNSTRRFIALQPFYMADQYNLPVTLLYVCIALLSS